LSQVIEDSRNLLFSSEQPFFVFADRDCCFHKRLLLEDESSKKDASENPRFGSGKLACETERASAPETRPNPWLRMAWNMRELNVDGK
jgi:hypothetical protein